MPAIVDFETISGMFVNLFASQEGQGRTVMQYKDRQSGAWTPITWEALRGMVEAMMGYLHAQGVRPGDRIAILSENRPEWAVADIATQLLGAVNVSLYTSLPAPQVEYILKDSGARLLFVSTGLQLKKAEQVIGACPDLQQIVAMNEPRADAPAAVRSWAQAAAEGAAYWKGRSRELWSLARAVRPGDLSALIYTSGTTGNPKGVMLTHDNFASNVKGALIRVPFGPEDHHLSFLPLCHSFERTAGYLSVLAAGAMISYAESIDTVSRNLEEVRPTVMISVPRLFEKVYNLIAKSVEEGSPAKKKIFAWAVETGKRAAARRKSGAPLGLALQAQQRIAHQLVFSKLHQKMGGNLRFAVSGGAALPRPIGEFFEAAGIMIIEGYGLTETAPVLAVNPYGMPRYGAVGHIMPGVTVGIQRVSDGKVIAALCGDHYPSTLRSDEGEIVVKGRNVMKGYWNNEAETRAAIDADGWYHTGDVGRFDNGYLLITDRIKHMIVSAGGKNIYPAPIEEQFKSAPYIDQILVVGEGREYLTALVVPAFEALRRYAEEQQIPAEPEEALLGHPQVRALYESYFTAYSRGAAAPEKIRDFRLIAEPFTVENNLMTPSLKLRRRAIEKQYADVIAAMYGQFA